MVKHNYIIPGLKITALYILFNSNKEQLYNLVFESIINIIIKSNKKIYTKKS